MTAVLPVVVGAVAAFLASGAWYAAFGTRLARLSPAYTEPGRPGATAAVELVRNLVLGAVVAGLVAGLDTAGVGAGLLLALALWLGFPAVLLIGSVFHERVPAALAAIHAGDWLLKLVVLTLIVALWR